MERFPPHAGRSGDRAGVDFDTRGRLEATALRALLPEADFEAYLCGPQAFVADVTGWLEAIGVDDARIRGESFG